LSRNSKPGTPGLLVSPNSVLANALLRSIDLLRPRVLASRPSRIEFVVGTQINGAPAEGVRIQAILDHEPGGADIYWLTLGNRLVVLTLFGPDKALQKAKPSWDVVLNSLHVEEIKRKDK